MLFTRDIAKQMILWIENGWIETSRQNPPLKKAALPILVSKGRKGQRKRCYLVIRAPLPQVMGTNKGPLRSHCLTPRIKIVPAGIFRCESWWLMKMEQISNTNREVVREWSVSGKAWCGDRGAGCPRSANSDVCVRCLPAALPHPEVQFPGFWLLSLLSMS